ncbi:MAG TPA: HDOD domain-containing protein [Tepidisphaeraceae bacterium]|nr:HDOD domain-containing protein [Tepidisphaeraceae bacterium]
MKTILIVDDMAILRDPIAATLRTAGYQTAVAGDGEEAIEQIIANPPDLILLDLSMPGMDGLGVLRFLKSTAKFARIPVILLTAVSDKHSVIEAGHLGVRDYLLKTDLSLPELLDRVARNLAPSTAPAAVSRTPHSPGLPGPVNSHEPARTTAELPHLLTRESCIARARHALEGKTLSGVVAQVITLTASPRAEASQISEMISRDPMLSARVLHAANSPAYISHKGVVTTIPEAIRNIGFKTVRNIAAATGIFDAMPETMADGFNPIRCWQHSFAVARICERLQESVNPEQAGVAYLVGLCHDLGEILFHTHFASEYRQVLALAQQTGKLRREVEQEMLGISHAELIRNILHHIGLPETIRVPVEDAHKVGMHGDSSVSLARILVMAELYANGIQLASSPESQLFPLTQTVCRHAIGKTDPERPDGHLLRSEVVSLTALLARLSVKEQQQLIAPMFPRTEVRIRLVRDAGFSSFDPIAAALESVSSLTISASLPSQAELTQIDAVVVLGQSTSSPRIHGAEIEAFKLAHSHVPLWWLVSKVDHLPPAHCQPVTLPTTLQAISHFITSAHHPTVKAA